MTGKLKVPALTVHQPYASLFFVDRDPKDIENRFWRPAHRGPLFIHAGRQLDRQALRAYRGWGLPDPLPRGAILGLVQLADVVRDSDSQWAERGCWHWTVSDRVALPEPVPCLGKQKLWLPDDETLELVRAQLARRALTEGHS